MTDPLIQGGQGRRAESQTDSAVIVAWCVLLGALTVFWVGVLNLVGVL